MIDDFTSTGAKFWHHPEALEGLRNGHPRPVVAHIMPTDVCQHKCAFCSVQSRDGDTLELDQIKTFVNQLKPLGLKACIISGGGNPILYKQFNELVDWLHGQGLQIGLITNGMPLKNWTWDEDATGTVQSFRASANRSSWVNVLPSTLDKLTWVRISCAGLDHPERRVDVPDIDPSKTTLGFSYVYHDIYHVPAEPHHGKVSTQSDLISLGGLWYDPLRFAKQVELADTRQDDIRDALRFLIDNYSPQYVRLLPNCLEPHLIEDRIGVLQRMANELNLGRAKPVVFIQHKPPAAPKACYLGYLHPVLNTDGYVYPCDSCVLNKSAGHKFANPWRIAKWDTVGELYAAAAHSLVDAPNLCPGCVFTKSNELLTTMAVGGEIRKPSLDVIHPNFV